MASRRSPSYLPITLEELLEAKQSAQARDHLRSLRLEKGEKNHFQVEKIMADKLMNGVKGYLIKWVDYE